MGEGIGIKGFASPIVHHHNGVMNGVATNTRQLRKTDVAEELIYQTDFVQDNEAEVEDRGNEEEASGTATRFAADNQKGVQLEAQQQDKKWKN